MYMSLLSVAVICAVACQIFCICLVGVRASSSAWSRWNH